MITLINAMFPSEGMSERTKISEKLEPSKSAFTTTTTADNQSRISQNYRIVGLFLQIAQETAEALQELRYNAFDALVKNFGCQMTALEVYQLVQDNNLLAESKNMLNKLPQLNTELSSARKSTNPNLVKNGFTFASLMATTVPSLAAFQVSNKMARLLRLRILAIVNDNKLIKNQEVPFTNYDRLQKIFKDSFGVTTDLVDGLQAEESRLAANFITAQLEQEPNSLRKEILIQALQDVRYKKVQSYNRTPIAMIPLLYNMEACIRLVGEGIVLVKNKLKLIGKPIREAKPCQVFVKMPEERILSPLEAREITDATPLFVVEGYVKTQSLAAKINEIGLMKLLLINSSDPSIQFLGCENTPLAQQLEEERGQLDTFRKSVVTSIFELDHVFCSSMREERAEFIASLQQPNDNSAALLDNFTESKRPSTLPALCMAKTTEG